MDRPAAYGLGFVWSAASVLLWFAQAGAAVARSFLNWNEQAALPPHEDPSKVTRYPDRLLDDLRKQGDPDTDALLEAIAQTGGPTPAGRKKAVGDFYTLLTGLTAPGAQAVPHHRYLRLEDYDATPYVAALRTWARQIAATAPQPGDESVARAAEFFRDHLFRILLILSTSSLLEAYACRNGVQVLASTKELLSHANRRLHETLQFVLYVNEPNGFENGGHATAAIQKVRLMHAAIRWRLRHGQPPWDDAALGVPVNGEDLLGTLMAFSGVVIRDLPKLWVELTSEQVEDYRYLWNRVGVMLGAKQEHLPESLGEMLALIRIIEHRQQRPSTEGRAMADALLKFHRALVGDLFDSVGLWMVNHLAGARICEILRIPAPHLLGPEATVGALDEAGTLWMARVITHQEKTFDDLPDEKFEPFDIPPSLRDLFDAL
jgi:hypothetical protein